MVTIRYLVHDVERSIAFYTQALSFTLDQQMGPAFARVSRGDLTLWLAGPHRSAARPMPDGQRPEPGGWNHLVLSTRHGTPCGLRTGKLWPGTPGWTSAPAARGSIGPHARGAPPINARAVTRL